MRKGSFLFTSESMTEGHPDKICDQISDQMLDEIYKSDPMGRVACETMCGMGFIVVTGEITTNTYIDVQKMVRDLLKDIGYTKPEYGFAYESVGILTSIHEQSSDIAGAVDAKDPEHKKTGAGDQGMMSGYATNETEELMPAPILYAHKLARKLAELRKNKTLTYLRPDGKTQITCEYNGSEVKRIDTVVVAAQHDPDVELEKLREDIKEQAVLPVLGDLVDEKTKYFINHSRRFVIGGPVADAGCTGRKIIADTYGGVGNHGGGAFSGKDPTKVDRTGAYQARHIAKNIVAAGLADRAEVQLAYVIGGTEPLNLFIDTHGTNKVEASKICDAVTKNFDLSPGGMIEELNLRRPIFRKTSCYGHFGRNEPEFTWEKTDKAEAMKRDAGL